MNIAAGLRPRLRLLQVGLRVLCGLPFVLQEAQGAAASCKRCFNTGDCIASLRSGPCDRGTALVGQAVRLDLGPAQWLLQAHMSAGHSLRQLWVQLSCRHSTALSEGAAWPHVNVCCAAAGPCTCRWQQGSYRLVACAKDSHEVRRGGNFLRGWQIHDINLAATARATVPAGQSGSACASCDQRQ